MSQTSGRNDGAYFGKKDNIIAIFFYQFFRDNIAYGAAHARDFKAVCETVMNKYVSRQGKYLCLVLQSSEWSREDKPVIIALKFSAVMLFVIVIMLKSKTFRGEQIFPIHHNCKNKYENFRKGK